MDNKEKVIKAFKDSEEPLNPTKVQPDIWCGEKRS